MVKIAAYLKWSKTTCAFEKPTTFVSSFNGASLMRLTYLKCLSKSVAVFSPIPVIPVSSVPNAFLLRLSR